MRMGGGGAHFAAGGGGMHFNGGGGGARFAAAPMARPGGGAAWAGGRTAYNGGGNWRGGGYNHRRFYPGAAVAGAVIGGAVIGGAYGDSYAYYGGPDYYDSGDTYYDNGNGYDAGPEVAVVQGGGDPGYCAQRYKSYDPASGTFLGYDGQRHPCP